jgi:hypothetical protein
LHQIPFANMLSVTEKIIDIKASFRRHFGMSKAKIHIAYEK